jgi:hypothetical protein
MRSGFDTGFHSGSMGSGGGFSMGFTRARGLIVASGIADPNALYSNFDTYITDGTRALHSTGSVGSPGVISFITRDNIRRTVVLKVDSTITLQGFRIIRTPEALGNWTTTTNDNFSATLSVKSGGTINGSAVATKTFSTNTKIRSATRTANPATVNSYRTEYDIYTVSDSSAVTLTAGTYTLQYWAVSTQLGVAAFHTSLVPIPTTTLVYPDPADSANTSYHPVIELLSTVS